MTLIIPYDPKPVEQFLTSLGHIEAEGCTEIRIIPKENYPVINGKREYVGSTVAGYYTDYEKAARDIAPFDGKAAICATLNPCDPKLMRRAHNKLAFKVKTTASDKDIISILWFPFDVDPVRPADTPSSDAELSSALECRDRIIREVFEPHGVPVIPAMSGNGGHGLIPLIGYPNNAETQAKIKRLLDWLSETFTDDTVSVDCTVGNPSRIWKVYGTLAVKGDNTSEAPYRRAVISLPEEIQPFDLLALLDEIVPPDWQPANERTKHTKGSTRRASSGDDYPLLDLEKYLSHYGYSFNIKQKDGRTIYVLDQCPFNPDHNRGEVCITQDALGKVGFKCFHNSCADKTWQEAKAAIGDPKPFYRGSQTHSNSTRNGSEPNGTDGASQTESATNTSEAPANDQPKPEVKTPEAEADEIRREILEAGMTDEGFGRTEKTKAIINRLVGLAPVDQAAFIEKMRKAGLGTKAVLEDQLKSAIKAQAQEKRQTVGKPPSSALPNIVINTRQMREITDETLGAIRKDNADNPSLFVRSGMLTRIRVDEKGHAMAQTLTVDGARGVMGRVANFLKETTREDIGTTYSAVSPPEVIAKDILSLPSYPQFLPLVSIVGFPILLESGEFRTQTGYDPESRCYYHAAGTIHIGDTEPTEENVQDAKRLIEEELLGDFPFVGDASKANTVAEMLTPLVRPLIKGATPLFAHDAATPGTGKSLLASVCTIPFSVSGTSVMTAGRDDDEWRKRITAKLMTGASHILIDNIKTKISSGDLSAALTAKSDWEDRILGQSQMIRLPVRCVWIATGNNLEFSDEIARRAVWIRLDAKVEKPWKRTGFKHKDLESWVGAHRSEILTALMVFVKKWFADGKPAGEEVMGSYSEWTQIVGGILKAVGIKGFLENAEALYEQVNTEREAWVEFFKAWATEFGSYDEKSGTWGAWVETDDERVEWKCRIKGDEIQSVGVKELFLIASHDDTPANDEGLGLLDAFLGRGNNRSRQTNLGRWLRKHRDRVFGGYRLEVVEKKVKGAAQFRLVNQNPPGEPGGEPSNLGSLVSETSNSTASGHVSILESEPGEPNTTPSGKIGEKEDTLSIISDDGAGIGSLGSLATSPDTRNPNDSTALGNSEPKLARFTDSHDVPKEYVAFLLEWYKTFQNHPAYRTPLLRIAKRLFPVKMGHSVSDQMDAAITALEGKVICGLSIVRDESGYHLEGVPESEVRA